MSVRVVYFYSSKISETRISIQLIKINQIVEIVLIMKLTNSG